MTTANRAEAVGIYVSVPFCRAKCSFCNFASGVSTPAVVDDYVAKLCGEIAGARAAAERLGAILPRRVDSVYFGGGTPSLLKPEQLRSVFAALRGEFEVEEGAEITLESAPGQIADELLQDAMRLGVNRVSLGVQSFVDKESAAVGRLHTEKECVREIARLQAAGVADVGADLIAGLPYQTRESWTHSLAVASGVGLAHLSVYMLEVDEDSRLGREVIAGGTRFHAHGVPQEEMAAELYEQACEVLPGAGFGQYEISNFAREGRESRHNRKYWERRPYVGFGLDAHSMLEAGGGAVRFANPDELKDFGSAVVDVVRVGEREALEERVFLGLRLMEGIEPIAEVAGGVEEMVEGGLMCVEGGRWKLTGRGRLVSNEVFGRLLEEQGVGSRE